MSFQAVDAIIYVEGPPEIDFRGGMFHIIQRLSPTCCIERVMRPSTFFESIAAAVAASRKYRFERRGEVVSLADHAAKSEIGSVSK